MKKVMLLAIASGITVCSFAQLNLGLQSTTQAAINATAATNVISNTTSAAAQATKATVNTTVNKVGEVKAATTSAVSSTGQQTLTTAKEISGSVNAGANVNSSSNGAISTSGSSANSSNNGSINVSAADAKAAADIKSETKTSASVK
jgi:hypothetical protein